MFAGLGWWGGGVVRGWEEQRWALGMEGVHMHAYFAIRVEKIASLLFET